MYLYLGKLGQLGKLANPAKKNFGKPKLTCRIYEILLYRKNVILENYPNFNTHVMNWVHQLQFFTLWIIHLSLAQY